MAPVRLHRVRSSRADARPTVVHVLVCGSPDRGDDGAPLLAAARARQRLPDDARIKVVGQVDIDHLLSIPRNDGVVIVDAATGLRSGSVVELPLSGLVEHEGGVRTRSSRALEIREVVAVAGMIRGHPMPGRVVAIGTRSFGPGRAISASVARAIPVLAEAILDAIDHVRVAAVATRPV